MSRPLTREQMLANERKWELSHRAEVTDESIANTEVRQMPWAVEALGSVQRWAVTHDYLTTDDVWGMLDINGIPRPSEPRAMGAVMRRAVREGYVAITDRTVQSTRRATAAGDTHHTSPVRVYRSLLF